jgi:hypothetical protein
LNFLTARNKLTRSLDSDRSENFIALAMRIGFPRQRIYGRHVGILVCIRGDMKNFHWDENAIYLEKLELFEEAENVYHKEIKHFPVSNFFLDAMLARFRSILENSEITYGIIAQSEAHYNEKGVFEGLAGLPEICSCVGFCIYVIKGFLFKSKKFIEINEWENVEIESHPKLMEWYNNAKEIYPNLSEEEYRKNHRRILPNEFVLAGYALPAQLPVTKAFIDNHSPYFDPYVSNLTLIDYTAPVEEKENIDEEE